MRTLSTTLTMICLAATTWAQQAALEPDIRSGPNVAAEALPAEAAAKVSAAVRAKAANHETLKLFLVLSRTGDLSMVEAVKARFRDRIRYADQRSKQFRGERERKVAAAERDALIIGERREMAALRRGEFDEQQQTIGRRIAQLGGRILGNYWLLNSMYVEVPASAVAALESDPDVVRVFEASPKQWHLAHSTAVMGAGAFWEEGYRGGTQVVAVIDSGVAEHEGFEGLRLSRFHQFDGAMETGCVDTTKPLGGEDIDGHGTHVAGIVAAQKVPGVEGATGMAPGLAELISIRVGAPGLGGRDCPEVVIHPVDVLRAIQFVVEETPATVVNLSLGGSTREDDLLENWFIDMAADVFDVAFVFAAGNSGRASTAWQLSDLALSYNGVAVANIDTRGTLTREDDRIADSSSRGPTRAGRRKPDIAAPGTNIVSLAPEQSVATLTGTSMAAPQISGALALLLDSGVAGVKEAKALLINSSDRVGWSRDWGWGGAHLQNALRQREWIASARVSAGAARYYRMGVDGTARSTLVWNRRIGGISPDGKTFFGDFRDLNLLAYEEATNRLVDASSSKIDNVEQIALRGEGVALVKVTHLSKEEGDEPYALAFSTGQVEEVKPGRLALRCTAPGEVSATMRYPVACELVNEGDLAVFGLNFRAIGPVGFQATTVAPVERIRPGQTISFRYDMAAPLTATGPQQYSIQVSGAAYGDEYRVTAPLQTNFRVPQPQNCTPVLTPASGTLMLQPHSQAFTLKIEFPHYNPQEPGVCTWIVGDSESWVSLPRVRSGEGNGEVVVSVSQAPISRLATRTGDLRVTVGRTGYPWTFTQAYRK